MIRMSPRCLPIPTWLVPATLAALTSCAAVPPQDAAAEVPSKSGNQSSLQQVQQIGLGAETRFARCDADCRRPSKKTLGGAQQPALDSSLR